MFNFTVSMATPLFLAMTRGICINAIIYWSFLIIKQQSWFQNVAKTSVVHLHMIKCLLAHLHNMNIHENREKDRKMHKIKEYLLRELLFIPNNHFISHFNISVSKLNFLTAKKMSVCTYKLL